MTQDHHHPLPLHCIIAPLAQYPQLGFGGKFFRARGYTMYKHEKGIYLLTAAFWGMGEKEEQALNSPK